MSAAESVPVVEGLFRDTPEGPRLVGSRCTSCGTPSFPRTAFCHHPECGDRTAVEEATFGPRGRLWTVAIQNYPPPAPTRYDEPYKPYAMGLVDMEADGLRVMGRIDAEDPEAVEVGGEVELVLGKIYTDEEGREVLTWLFRVVG